MGCTNQDMDSEEQIFNRRVASAPRWMLLFKRTVILVVALHLLIGIVSSYRAYFQVHSLNITTGNVLQQGSLIETKVVTYGRTTVDVRLDLIQKGRVVTLQEHRVAGNEFGFYDPRTQSASFSVIMTPESLDRLEAGPAVLRATAIGRHQWMRLPPPLVREIPVVLVTVPR